MTLAAAGDAAGGSRENPAASPFIANQSIATPAIATQAIAIQVTTTPSASGQPAADQPLVAVVVLNWNDAEATLRCLRSLAGTSYPRWRVIVVDNASIDGSAQRVAAAAPDALLIRNPVNLGFTGGVNAGISRALQDGADYVWLLNSDAVVPPDALARLVAAAEADQRIGLVSPVFHAADRPDVPEHCLAIFDPQARFASQTADPAQAAVWQRTCPHRVLLLGTALLVRRDLLRAIGPLDPQFFAYVEDVDFSLRCHAAGFKAVALPDVVVLHTFKQPVEAPATVAPYVHYFMSRNYPLLWRKLPGPVWWRKSSLWFLRQRLAQIVRMRDQPRAVEAVIAGLWDGVRGRGGAYDPDRRPPALLRLLLGRGAPFWLALLDRRWPSRGVAG